MKYLIFILVVLLLMNASEASFNAEKQKILSEKISIIVAGNKDKVGYIFIDTKSGLGVQLNGAREFPAASVAKVAVMAAAYNLSYLGKIDLGQKIKFRESDKLGGSGVLQWMKAGNEYTLWNLIRLMIVLSDNTATKMVVETIGMEKINEYLQNQGLNKTVISDPTMLIGPPSREVNLTSPYDLARLMLKIQKGQGFFPDGKKEMLSFLEHQRYRWGIWRGVPQGVKVADKTGNLEGILNDAGIVFTKYGDYILSIFTREFKKQREARLLINELSKVTYEEYAGETVKAPLKILKKKSPDLPQVISHADIKNAIMISIDLCPFHKPYEKRLFEYLERLGRKIKKPLPVAICVSGPWLKNHQTELEGIKKMYLAVTWVNHSYSHPLKDDFLNNPKADFKREVEENVKLMKSCGLDPSRFFRFPGLRSNSKRLNELHKMGYVALGADAWLAKGQMIKDGSIILVHGNGNEPAGVKKLIAYLSSKEMEIRSGKLRIVSIEKLLKDRSQGRDDRIRHL